VSRLQGTGSGRQRRCPDDIRTGRVTAFKKLQDQTRLPQGVIGNAEQKQLKDGVPRGFFETGKEPAFEKSAAGDQAGIPPGLSAGK
jgi:hypothetical protein